MSNVIRTTKKDIVWNYMAIFFNMGAGVIVLPIILHFLNAEEIGLYYLMLTISSMVALIDFGFAPQIGRNITYALSGAKHIEREGLHELPNSEPNYRLLAIVIGAAKFIYRRLSIVVSVIMLTLGTFYIHHVTHGFLDVDYSLWIWLVFCFTNFFNIYFIYYRSLLTGSGKIYESSVSMILSKGVYILVCFIMLAMGCGLFSVVVANMLELFTRVFYSHVKFYTPHIKSSLPIGFKKQEIRNAINSIWYNAKKLGINSLGSFAILKLNLFLIGLFLPLHIVGAFGVLTQVVQTLSSVASAMFHSFVPQISSLQVRHNNQEIIKIMSFSTVLFWITILLSGVLAIIVLPPLLSFIHSTIELPDRIICLTYLIVMALEGNHSNFATVIATSNKVPFVAAGLTAGALIAIFTYLSLCFTNLGLYGVVLVQGIVQLSYNNWKWPAYVLNDLDCDTRTFIKTGFVELINYIKYAKNNIGRLF